MCLINNSTCALTAVDRTYASAENLLQALFPPQQSNKSAASNKHKSNKRSRAVLQSAFFVILELLTCCLCLAFTGHDRCD